MVNLIEQTSWFEEVNFLGFKYFNEQSVQSDTIQKGAF